MSRRKNILLGLVALVATGAIGVYTISGLGGRTGGPYQVRVNFDRVGQLLRVSGDVKLRGVLVGKVHEITKHVNGATEVTLTLDPGLSIPAGVSASIRGKTLFGEKYVELVDPPRPSGETLAAGTVIPESRTVAPFELEQVLESLQPVLDATDPGDLGGALKALAQGLAGQEEEARRAIDNTLVLLETLGAGSEDLDRLLSGVDEGSDAFARGAPDFVASLEQIDVLAREVVANADDLRALLHDAPDWLDVVAELVQARYADLVDLSVKGADILDLVASHASELPAAVESLKDFTQAWNTNLSAPCDNAAGTSVQTVNPGSTCWQIWMLTAEPTRSPGGYGAEGPQPGSSVAAAAYVAQLRQLLRLPFGTAPSDVATLLHSPVRDARGLIPEALL